MKTTLLYLKDFVSLVVEAKVISVVKEDGRDVVVLNETIFYPQGGGQPYDQGTIESLSAKFLVEEVRFVEGVVKHIGKFESGAFAVGEEVTCKVDGERRKLNARIHSAGHLVDKAIAELKLPWKSGKDIIFQTALMMNTTEVWRVLIKKK